MDSVPIEYSICIEEGMSREFVHVQLMWWGVYSSEGQQQSSEEVQYTWKFVVLRHVWVTHYIWNRVVPVAGYY